MQFHVNKSLFFHFQINTFISVGFGTAFESIMTAYRPVPSNIWTGLQNTELIS